MNFAASLQDENNKKALCWIIRRSAAKNSLGVKPSLTTSDSDHFVGRVWLKYSKQFLVLVGKLNSEPPHDGCKDSHMCIFACVRDP